MTGPSDSPAVGYLVGDRVWVLPRQFASSDPAYDGVVTAVAGRPGKQTLTVRAIGDLAQRGHLEGDFGVVLLPESPDATPQRVQQQALLCARWDARWVRRRLAVGDDPHQLYQQYWHRSAYYRERLSPIIMVEAFLTSSEIDISTETALTDVRAFFAKLCDLLDV